MAKRQILILVGAVLLIGLLVGGYFYWKKYKATPVKESSVLENAGQTAKTITESATKGVLPSINPETNPLQSAPDINPASQSNPFKDIKTNPFQ